MQGRFLNKPSGDVYFGAEFAPGVQLGLISRGVVKVLNRYLPCTYLVLIFLWSESCVMLSRGAVQLLLNRMASCMQVMHLLCLPYLLYLLH